jgi:uncharacterized protein (TIGR03067 family)
MRSSLVPTAVLVLTYTGGVLSGDPQPADARKALQGTWRTTLQFPKAEPLIVCEKMVIDGDKLVFHYELDGKRFPSPTRFEIDPNTTPKRLDFAPTEGSEKGKRYLAIYEFKDGQLRIAYRGPGLTRPRDFRDFEEGNNNTSFLDFEPVRER